MANDEESDKAKQEIAKALVAYRPEIIAAGKFISETTKQPLKQVLGFLGDVAGIARIELLLLFEKRYHRKLLEKNINDPKAIPLGVIYPLLSAALIEDDESLAEMFASLLASYASDSEERFTPKTFIDTVRSMTPFEAYLLGLMVDAPGGDDPSRMLFTIDLPDDISFVSDENITLNSYPEPKPKVLLALASLQHLGCIQAAQSIDGTTYFQQASVTYYGEQFMLACR